MSKIIQLKNVSKTYQIGETKVNALNNLSLDVNKGEFIAIMGPSGSGKSTAMNMVGSLDTPTTGQVILDGYDISKLEESQLATIRGKKIGFVFQTFNLLPSMTALENVMLPIAFQNKISRELREKKATDMLNLVGLGDRLHNKPGQLSGGQRQRVAIARALVNEPEVILADEPTGNLDSKTGQDVMNLLENLNRKHKKTIILVTHDKEIAKRADRILNLKDGTIARK